MDFSRFPRSAVFQGFEWTGARLSYADRDIKGDTYPLTWADDDVIYTAAGDPCWGASHSGFDIEKFEGGPTDYKIHQTNAMPDYTGWGSNGAKPTGMICVDNVLYLAIQNLKRFQVAPYGAGSQSGSDATILCSNTSHRGCHWIPHFDNLGEPMFPGCRFGGPAFVNFGKNNANARDNHVYAVSGDHWDNGCNLRLGRVPKTRIMEVGAWEWVCGFGPDYVPVWNGRLADAIPVLSLHKYLSAPEMVYLAAAKRYLLFTWRLRRDFCPTEGSDLMIFESPEPWGPFSFVHYEECWEGVHVNPYCPRLPLKWLNLDGLSGWLQFSGTWDGEYGHSHEHGLGYYRSHVRPFRLLPR